MSRIRRSRALIALLVAVILSTAVGIPAVADLNLILGASAQVSYTQGDGVNVRDAIGFGGSVIATLPENHEVVVHDGPIAANDGSYWYYISSTSEGVEGWIIADFLALPGASGGTDTSGGQYGEIAFTGGEGVNVRASASSDSGVLTTLFEGTAVTIVAGPEWDANGWAWTLINYDGVEGWVLDDYVAWGGDSSSGSTAERVLDATWTAYVANTEGFGLRLRANSSYDAETIVVMDEGAAVTVVATQIYGADGTEWWNVTYEGLTGYAAAYYLSEQQAGDSSAGSQPAEPADTATEEPAAEEPAADESLDVWAGANAMVVGTNGAGLNLRYEMGYGSGVVTTLAEGSIVYVIEGPMWDGDSNPWFQVDASGTVGWAHGSYLQYTEDAETPAATEPAEVAVASPEPTEEPTEEPADSGSGSVGASIVAEALNYVGLPYVWGGTGPSGFDCSGFVHYVLTQVFGYNFTRDLAAQSVSGRHVDAASLAPGDLVFFQNTYKWGLSHVGIYIGDGQFVHAGSERTGVTISNMWDSYWGSRYYTARRVLS